jgi:hypothetical protein
LDKNACGGVRHDHKSGAAFATKLGYYGFEFRGVVKGGLDRLDRQR